MSLPSKLALIAFLFWVAYLIAIVRRRLLRLVCIPSHPMLPLSDPPTPPCAASVPLNVYPAPAPLPVRHEKQNRDYTRADFAAAASGSGGAPQYGAGPSRSLPAPAAYGLAPGTQVDDDLVERIAQRVARIVHDDAPPPTYVETSTVGPA
ncbi:hypothetical protein B0H10DRAFT_1102710 [Mycena sp. CBHHK59/15]|nr:hypothetical protein B0H10DRAFT_1102710 [Mycena sp. CBHHK59/15]